ncbi:MAG: ATP-dependent protease subunit HslV [Limnochordaceae bacterium]|uniref:ATP-dependent protease subunit HslV n=1 Tax=Carboxydichorda subterranea TaxID=3109565 RepID=A0ABZ1C1W5_9FIRM|nr:ATP-dependent protease subunit HslV [Limnochorda sp. L945t]MBE3598032.1 ATP-dependent protease subunit HslV [Limnochordaceae bacterium]WRP18919.1 ATP-dependent protease subunit HslV [Limnochorda sp. L945t]
MRPGREPWHGTTVLAVVKDGRAAMGGDGQVTMAQQTIIKQSARKVRRLLQGRVLAGFAGAAADGLTLLERFEAKLEAHSGSLPRAAAELARDWRTDRVLRRLDALLLVADTAHLLVLSGNGEIVEPDDGVAAIGSGGPVALAAARALLRNTTMEPARIVEEALTIAAGIDIYTNDRIVVDQLEEVGSKP